MAKGVVFPNRPTGILVTRAQRALGMTHREFGEALGSSQRTALRWAAGQSSLSVSQLRALAALVYAKDPALAAELSEATSETLESLGIVVPPPPPPPPAAMPPPNPALTDAVVCAVAEEMAVVPTAVRGWLLVAFRRARELGLTVEEVERALAERAARNAPG